MAVVLGKDIRIYAGTSGTTPIIAGAKSCTISERCDLIEKASASNQTSKEFVGGRTEWEINISHLVVVGSEYQGLLKVNTTVRLRIGGSTMATGDYLTGNAIIKTQKLTAPIGGLANGTIVFLGNGPLE